jgi:hypothetical protein
MSRDPALASPETKSFKQWTTPVPNATALGAFLIVCVPVGEKRVGHPVQAWMWDGMAGIVR